MMGCYSLHQNHCKGNKVSLFGHNVQHELGSSKIHKVLYFDNINKGDTFDICLTARH